MRPGREQVPLHRLAGKADIFTQCEAVSSLCYISELLQQRMPGVVAQDLSVVHTNSHKEQIHSKLLQEQQIPVVAEVERLMAAQAAEVLAEVG